MQQIVLSTFNRLLQIGTVAFLFVIVYDESRPILLYFSFIIYYTLSPVA